MHARSLACALPSFSILSQARTLCLGNGAAHSEALHLNEDNHTQTCPQANPVWTRLSSQGILCCVRLITKINSHCAQGS